MPTPRRRSSRIRAGSASPKKSMAYTPSRLTSLAEDEDSPITPTRLENAFPKVPTKIPTTPLTAHVKLALNEMHPSKTQQSTTKEPDSGLRLGFADIGVLKNQQTPSKPMADSSFEFRFARPGPQLSTEAQKMMDDLRGEALRVKARLIAEREEARNTGENTSNSIAGRRIAQAKGKAGRFSDVHMAEFKKMDSIAGHPSSFRAQPGRALPVKSAMKRSQSQAKLDEREDIKEQPTSARPVQSARLENDAPSKRARKGLADDTSTARPVSRDTQPSTPQKQASTLAFITTPTQSSLARATGVKKPTTQIPSLTKSASKPNLAAVSNGLERSATNNSFSTVPKSEPKSFMRSPGKVDRLKSMLGYPSAILKKPIAPSALPVFTKSPTKPNYNKELPSLPMTPGGLSRSKSVKQFGFTPETVVKNADSTRNSPSPVKSGIPRSISRPNLFVKNSVAQSSDGAFKPSEITYPPIGNHPSVRESAKDVDSHTLAGFRPLPALPRPVATEPQAPSVPGSFTFRSDHTINFGPSPTGFGSSPGQASVRQVRPSIFSGMPGSFPVSNKENRPVPSVPHGFSNKKRHRAGSEEDNDEEVERSPKKLKTGLTQGPSLMTQKLEAAKSNPLLMTPSPKKKGMSLSRLNMLSRPKLRK